MKKKLVALLLAGTMVFSMMACGGNGDSESKTENVQTKEITDTPEAETTEEDATEVTYQSILDNYTKQIQDATPGLVEEYNAESVEKAGDINALAELSNSKIEKLAEICNAGIEEMAELMTKNGDEYETYEEWAGKLQDVYTEYSTQITDAYTSSASNMSAEELLDSIQQ